MYESLLIHVPSSQHRFPMALNNCTNVLSSGLANSSTMVFTNDPSVATRVLNSAIKTVNN